MNFHDTPVNAHSLSKKLKTSNVHYCLNITVIRSLKDGVYNTLACNMIRLFNSVNSSPLTFLLKHTKAEEKRASSVVSDWLQLCSFFVFCYPRITMLRNFRDCYSRLFCICCFLCFQEYHCSWAADARTIINLWKISLNIFTACFWGHLRMPNAQIWFYGNYKSGW